MLSFLAKLKSKKLLS